MKYRLAMVTDAPARIRAALDRQPVAVRELVGLLAPVVQVRVTRELRRRGPVATDPRQEVEDLTQEIFARLFADDGRLLRTWDPAKGLSLKNFVGLIAQRQAADFMKSGRRNRFRDDPLELEDIEARGEPVPDVGPEVASREELSIVLSRLQQSLSPLGFRMFLRLVVQQESVQEVATAEGMSESAVYAWQSRLARRMRALWCELSQDGSGAAVTSAVQPAYAGKEG